MNRPDSGAANDKGRLPPYISYRTLRTFVHDLHEHDIPDRIDRTVLTRFSGTVGKQLMTALRFLGLIGADDRPTEALAALVDAFQTDRWRPTLETTLRTAYGAVMELDLARATPGQLNETFKRAYPAEEQVIRKCRAFFLAAAQDAGLEINKRVLERARPRPGLVRVKRVVTAEPSDTAAAPSEAEREPAQPSTPPEANGHDDRRPRSPYYAAVTALWACYHPERISEEDEKALLRVIRMLKRQEAGLDDAAHEEPSGFEETSHQAH